MASSDESLSVAAWKSRVERVLGTRWSGRIDWTDEVFLEHYLCELDDSTEILELVALLPAGPAVRDRLAQLLERNALYTLLGSDYANAYFVLSPWCAVCEALRETPAADLGEAFSRWSSIAWTGHRLFSRDDDWFLIAQETIDQHYRR